MTHTPFFYCRSIHIGAFSLIRAWTCRAPPRPVDVSDSSSAWGTCAPVAVTGVLVAMHAAMLMFMRVALMYCCRRLLEH